ncbi:MAG: hypothetical protein WDN28_29010 [Chthoniobacter sp.]
MAAPNDMKTTGTLESTSQFISRGCAWVRKKMRASAAEASARRFMKFLRRKWPTEPVATNDSVVLLGLFPHKIATYCNLHLAQHIARRTGSRIEAFKITNRANPLVEQVYAAGGARVGLDASFIGDARPEIEKQADAMFAGLRSKWDLVELHYEGLKIGDLVYDSYLRYLVESTVKLDDPRLREIILKALLVYVATTNYLKVRKVVAFITDDYAYHECGVVTRLMVRAQVPVHLVSFGPDYFVFRLHREPGSNAENSRLHWPYAEYPALFRSMPPEQQLRCREKGREHLDKKLAGKPDRFTLGSNTAFGESTGKLFVDSGKPRILVLMHDFFDAPHGFRWMLFPDFYEWSCFLFERASETPFEWYVKPHPASWDPARARLNENNLATFQKLQERFPKITFLPSSTSNRQIVNEGINAMFTMYGTAGHEFARMGIPVVNAGDNRHIAYDFNYHPRTVEEYADLIARADRLTITPNPDDLAEYVYMNYYYLSDQHSTGANPLPPSFFSDVDFEAHSSVPTGYDRLIHTHDPEREKEMEKYYDRYLNSHPGSVATA